MKVSFKLSLNDSGKKVSGCGVHHIFVKAIDVSFSEKVFDSLSRQQKQMIAREWFNAMAQFDLEKIEVKQ